MSTSPVQHFFHDRLRRTSGVEERPVRAFLSRQPFPRAATLFPCRHIVLPSLSSGRFGTIRGCFRQNVAVPRRAQRRAHALIRFGRPAVAVPVAMMPDSERFFPDRFAPSDGEDRRHHCALIDFGGGKHAHIGKNFVRMQPMAIRAVLLDRFDFLPCAGFPRPNYGSWVTGAESPGRVRCHRHSEPSVFR